MKRANQMTVKAKNLNLGDRVKMDDDSLEEVVYLKHLTSHVIKLGFKKGSVVVGACDLVEVAE
jgi:hypothetical protein